MTIKGKKLVAYIVYRSKLPYEDSVWLVFYWLYMVPWDDYCVSSKGLPLDNILYIVQGLFFSKKKCIGRYKMYRPKVVTPERYLMYHFNQKFIRKQI